MSTAAPSSRHRRLLPLPCTSVHAPLRPTSRYDSPGSTEDWLITSWHLVLLPPSVEPPVVPCMPCTSSTPCLFLTDRQSPEPCRPLFWRTDRRSCGPDPFGLFAQHRVRELLPSVLEPSSSAVSSHPGTSRGRGGCGRTTAAIYSSVAWAKWQSFHRPDSGKMASTWRQPSPVLLILPPMSANPQHLHPTLGLISGVTRFREPLPGRYTIRPDSQP